MPSRKKKPPAVPFDVALKRVWNAPPKQPAERIPAARKAKPGK